MLDGDGVISGTPTASVQNTSFTVTGTDALGQTASVTYTHFTVFASAPSISKIDPAQGVTNGGTQVTITGSHFTGATVSFDGTDVIPGAGSSDTEIHLTTPSHAKAETVTVSVDKAASGAWSATTKFTYVDAVLSFTPPAGQLLPNARVGEAYSQQVTMKGGLGTVTYSLDGGTALPAGLTLDPATGLISGTPTASVQNASFTVTGTDSLGQTASVAYTLKVNTAIVTITSITPNQGLTNGGDAIVITGTGFTGAKVSFDGTDVAPGAGSSDTEIHVTTPPHAKAETVTVAVDNADGSAGAGKFFTYVAPVLSFTPAAGKLPDATVGQAYSQQVTLNGGLGTVTYSITGPAGLPLRSHPQRHRPDLRHALDECCDRRPHVHHPGHRHARADREHELHHHGQGAGAARACDHRPFGGPWPGGWWHAACADRHEFHRCRQGLVWHG